MHQGLPTLKSFRRLLSGILNGLFLVMLWLVMQGPCSLAQTTSNVLGAEGTVRVDATPGHAINSFDPDSALGSSIDVLSRRDIDMVYYAAYHSGIALGGLGSDHVSQ